MNKLTYEQQLEQTGSLIYTTVGRSMRPFLRSQEDLVVIERKTGARFSKYDVVLYRRASGKYVLHRIVKVCPDSYTLCGDNCSDLEPGITDDQILGVLTAVIRNGQKQDVNSSAYRLKVRIWCALYPLRVLFLKAKRFLSRLKKKLKKASAPSETPDIPQSSAENQSCTTASCNSPADTSMNAIYLMACALHGTVPEEDAVQDLDALFRFCSRHSVISMVAMALENLWKTKPPADQAAVRRWNQARDKAIRKNILLNAERDRILRHLESIGCWYMPLKGSLLQYDYPKFGMRQMSDNDILFDTRFSQQICDFMSSSGYTVKEFGIRSHDTYLKEPIYNFEMHRRLFSPVLHDVLAEYYGDFMRLMVRDDHNQMGYHLSDEDFYVYMTAHSYKHFSHGGIGIRSLADIYVFLNKHGETLDWVYIETELHKLKLWDYDLRCRQLSRKIFSEPRKATILSREEQELLDVFIGSGTYGNQKQAVENALDKIEKAGASGGLMMKLRYFWNRIFPPLDYMAIIEPDLLQHHWKLPLAYAKRLLGALFKRPKQLVNEFRYLLRSNRTTK